ncbi:carbonic anhydrase family protein [Variovorax sp. J22R133]|uniref:carbonic anhydrase n=1 Tax=Variovorax brevis TaxID=3053503 RepID=UPI002576BC87|nr:carbonic anhydrase family protein [Variovorax sp. J22R133]MDM0112843.1 carbonic anhydrase family protein [Variovorax sp. J22R133]
MAFAGEEDDERASWTYRGHRGAEHWAQLHPGFRACQRGKSQSPINIDTKRVQRPVKATPLAFAYVPGSGEVVNNGHTIQVNLSAPGSLDIGGVEYQLLQFHFHAPSEERIDGKAYPLVAHLVHKNAQGQLAVVAVLFRAGKENAALQRVFEHMPLKKGEVQPLATAFNPADLLPADHTHYAFMGSVTTPPCSENVRWQVLRKPVEISAAQLGAFKKLYGMNARPLQPRNNRPVLLAG